MNFIAVLAKDRADFWNWVDATRQPNEILSLNYTDSKIKIEGDTVYQYFDSVEKIQGLKFIDVICVNGYSWDQDDMDILRSRLTKQTRNSEDR